VGMFLIYSTMAFAIVQRRAVFGTLLAVGLARRELLLAVWLEALVLGAAATVLGLVLGHFLAEGLVDLVLATMGDFSFSSQVTAAAPSPEVYALGAALGIGAALVSSLGPAVAAARGAPAVTTRGATLERRSTARSRIAAWAAVPSVAVAAVLLLIDSRSLELAF